MPEITLDSLRQKITLFTQQRQQCLDQANALAGALQLAQQLVLEMDPPKKPRRPKPPPPQD